MLNQVSGRFIRQNNSGSLIGNDKLLHAAVLRQRVSLEGDADDSMPIILHIL